MEDAELGDERVTPRNTRFMELGALPPHSATMEGCLGPYRW